MKILDRLYMDLCLLKALAEKQGRKDALQELQETIDVLREARIIYLRKHPS